MTRAPTTRRRASVLIELMLAVTLFVLAGGAVAAALERGLSALERVRLERLGADHAASALALIASGERTPASLQGEVPAWNGVSYWSEAAEGGSVDLPEPTGWLLEIEVEPTDTPPVSRVTVTAVYEQPGEAPGSGLRVRVTEWVALRAQTDGSPIEPVISEPSGTGSARRSSRP